MTDQLVEAATLAGVGVAVVMTALTILMLAIVVLTRLAPGGKETKTEAALDEVECKTSQKQDVAVMAVAVALTMEAEDRASDVGGPLAGASGQAGRRWASAGREQLMRSRAKAGRKWGGASGQSPLRR